MLVETILAAPALEEAEAIKLLAIIKIDNHHSKLDRVDPISKVIIKINK